MDVATRALHVLLPRQSQGSARDSPQSNSASTLVSTLIPTILIALAIFGVFLFLRRKHSRVYNPRALDGVVDKHGRTPAPQSSLFGWISDFKKLPDDHVLRHQSLDGYLFLRYMKMLTIIAFVGCCITWPVLFPVNATGGAGQKQLDILSFSNVVNPNRYYAHAIITWLFLGFVLVVVTKESIYFIGLRQALFLSSLHAQRLSSRTVLFMSIPQQSLSEQSLREVFGAHVRKIWIVPDYSKLEDTVEERDKLWNKLEAGEQKVITDANKDAIKKAKKGKGQPENPAAILDNKKSRPTHRLKFLIGKKVDTIDYGRTKLPQLGAEIEKMQTDIFDGRAKATPAAFVEFSSQAAAQEALQFTAKEKRTQYSPRLIGVQPEEVIWKNLAVSATSRKIKMTLATIAITLLTIFWAIPVTFVGALTNINALTNKVGFLSFINDIPDVILGVVTGLLPTILLAVLMALVPIIFGLLAKFAGAPTLSAVEMKVQSWYFVFQVIQVFLVTTFSSGAAAVASQIVENPTSAISLLAENLPKASNFYISYFVLQGLMAAALTLLNLVPFLMINILGKFLDKTPRKSYNRWMALAGLGWGSTYPKFTNLGVIALAYSSIAPLVLGFATIGFGLIYLGFRYNFLFVYGLKVDMKGENYPKALQQLLTGAYLSTLCLLGLFVIKAVDFTAAVGPLVLMAVLLAVLIATQVAISVGLGPLKSQIPLNLLAENRDSTMITSDPEAVEKPGETGVANGQSTVWRPSVDPNKSKGNFLTRKFEGLINKARYKAQSQLSETEIREKPSYLPEDLNNAYMHPSLAAQKKPLVWLARDNLGLSKLLVDGNNKAGVDSTDDGAWLNDKGKVEWNVEQPTQVPIYEKARLW